MSYPYDKPGIEIAGGYRGGLVALLCALAFSIPWFVGVVVICVWVAERIFS
jgi:hypothetical protein